MAIHKDDGDWGISFGPDGLVIPLRGDDRHVASSKLGTYYERGLDDDRRHLFKSSPAVHLEQLFVLVGVYEAGEDIPYSGGVLDMTSG